jgi:type IV secretory pathway TrbD component
VKAIKNNLVEITLLTGIAFISVGLFVISTIAGCFGTGIMFWGLAFLIWHAGGE